VKDVIDITDQPLDEALQTLGKILLTSVHHAGAAIFIQRQDGSVTLMHPRLFDKIPDEDLAAELIQTWSEEEVESFFAAKFAQAAERAGG
jgi:hypothetical protein